MLTKQMKRAKPHTSSRREIRRTLAKRDSRQIITRSCSQRPSMDKVISDTLDALPSMSKKSHWKSSPAFALHKNTMESMQSPPPPYPLRISSQNICNTSEVHDVKHKNANPKSDGCEVSDSTPQSQRRIHLLSPSLMLYDSNDENSMEGCTSSLIQSVAERSTSSTSIRAEQVKLHHVETNQDTLPSGSADAAKEDTTWNEYLNLAYLYKRGAKILTLDTLPPEEEWYKAVFAAQEDLRKHPMVPFRRCDDGLCCRRQLSGSSTVSEVNY